MTNEYSYLLFHNQNRLKPRMPTSIEYDRHKYVFEGFSLFSHEPLPHDTIPDCLVVVYNNEYKLNLVKEDMIEVREELHSIFIAKNTCIMSDNDILRRTLRCASSSSSSNFCSSNCSSSTTSSGTATTSISHHASLLSHSSM